MTEMVAVMRKAASLGENECDKQHRLISRLATENKVSIANGPFLTKQICFEKTFYQRGVVNVQIRRVRSY